MGGNKFAGSLNCQVSLAKNTYFCGAPLRKRLDNLKSLHMVATPYMKRIMRLLV